MNSVADRKHYPPLHLNIRHVRWSQPFGWLRLAASDVRMSASVSYAYGIAMSLLGWILMVMLGTHPYIMAAAITGFLLVAPIMSTGIFEVARRLQRRERATFDDSLEPLRVEQHALFTYGVALAVLALAWFIASDLLLLSARVPTPSVMDTYYLGFFRETTFEQLVAYAGIGGVLAVAVFAMSVITVPVIIDRHASAGQAIRASLEVVRTNPVAMFVWAGTIVLLTALGFATMLIGMVVIIPVLGHASWRAYRDLVAG